jgi:hypothetical protein
LNNVAVFWATFDLDRHGTESLLMLTVLDRGLRMMLGGFSQLNVGFVTGNRKTGFGLAVAA